MDTAITIGVLVGVAVGLLVPTLAVAGGTMGAGSSGMMMPGMMHGDDTMRMDEEEMRAMHQACLDAMAHHHPDANETQPDGGT